MKRRLEWKILSLMFLVLLMSFGILFTLFSERLRRDLIDKEVEKLTLMGRSLHRTIDRSMMNFKADIIRHLVEDLNTVEGIVRMQIVRGKDNRADRNSAGTEAAFADLSTIEDVGSRQPGFVAEHPEWTEGHRESSENKASGVDNPEFRSRFARFLKELESAGTNDDAKMAVSMKEEYYLEEIDGKRSMTFLKPLPNFNRCALCHGGDHAMRGILMISTPMEGIDREIALSQRRLLLISLCTLLAVGGLVKVSMDRIVRDPVQSVVDRMRDIAEGEGDLTKRIEFCSADEIGELARGVNNFMDKLRQIVSDVFKTAKNVIEGSNRLLTGTREISGGIDIQRAAVEEACRSLEQMSTSIRGIAEHAGELSSITEESTSAIQQLSTAINEIATGTEVLSASVEETSSSILQMSSAIKQIDGHVGILSQQADETTTSMVQIDSSIKEIRTNVLETVDLFTQMVNNGEEGQRSVGLVIKGMDQIKGFSEEVAQVIYTLQSRTEEIGKILNVIDEVADQTNLLALNAAIIAAQAGEHGKGFGVVANEIKDLAERTASSTQEIHEIIMALQKEGHRAVESITRGSRVVDEGVVLSQSAGEVLKKTVENSNKSAERIMLISRATEEQTKGVQRASEAMQRVNQLVQEIAKAMQEESRGSGLIIEATERMREITQRVKAATAEQAKGAERINEVVQEIYRRTKEIAEGTRHHKGKGEEIVRAIEKIKGVMEVNVDAVARSGQAVEELIAQARRLEEEMSRFKLS